MATAKELLVLIAERGRRGPDHNLSRTMTERIRRLREAGIPAEGWPGRGDDTAPITPDHGVWIILALAATETVDVVKQVKELAKLRDYATSEPLFAVLREELNFWINATKPRHTLVRILTSHDHISDRLTAELRYTGANLTIPPKVMLFGGDGGDEIAVLPNAFAVDARIVRGDLINVIARYFRRR
jgi:hypothetical protein